jgi:large subunit ribosomal protein L29
MPILRLKEINDMSPEDRTKKLAELRAELSRMRTMIHAGGAVENPTRVRELRRTIAQVLTIENEIKLGIRKGASVAEAKKPTAQPKPAAKPAETKEKETA